jgi:hypothetical protein
VPLQVSEIIKLIQTDGWQVKVAGDLADGPVPLLAPPDNPGLELGCERAVAPGLSPMTGI